MQKIIYFFFFFAIDLFIIIIMRDIYKYCHFMSSIQYFNRIMTEGTITDSKVYIMRGTR